MALFSMTGYGSAPCILLGQRYTIDIRSVNHRFLDVKFYLPRFLEPHEAELLSMVKERFHRGHIEVAVRLQGASGQALQSVVVDTNTAKALYQSLEGLRNELKLPDPPTLQLLASFKEIFSFADISAPPESTRQPLHVSLRAALQSVEAMREQEGKMLDAEIQAHVQRCQELALALSARAPEALSQRQQRLFAKLKALLQELPKGTIDQETVEARAAIELSVIADKVDIAEELARLRSHFEQLLTLFTTPRPHGKKLDFLMQELNREANTIGSKVQDSELSRLVVELKTEIERIREQVQNVE